MIQLSKLRRYIFLMYIFLLPLLASNTFWGKIPFSTFLTLILLFFSFLEILKKENLLVIVTIEDKLLIAFIFICIISIVFSSNIVSSFRYFIGLVPQLFMYIFMKKEFRKEKISIIKTLVLSSVMVAVINMWQVKETIEIYGYKSNDIFASINYYGSIVAFSIPMIIYLLKSEIKNRKLYYIILVINVLSSLWSFSKVAIGLIGIYFIYYIYIFFRRKGQFVYKILVILVIFIVVFTGANFINNNNRENINLNKMMENFIGGDSLATRKILNNVSKNMVIDNLFTGVGLGNYKLATYNYSELYYSYHPGSEAHDLMLSIFAEVGIFGMLIFLFILLRGLYIFIKKREIDFFMYAIGIILSIMFYGTGLKNWYFWILIAIAATTNSWKKEVKNGNF